VDYGDRRVGLALSDVKRVMALPHGMLEVASREEAVHGVAQAARETGAALIVVGYPLLLSGERGELSRRVDRFVAALREEVDVPVVTWDERLSTVEATRVLRLEREGRRGGRGARRPPRGAADAMAASLLLASWLERTRGRGEDAARPEPDGHEDGID
jgi:putative Holliday junction resolvase